MPDGIPEVPKRPKLTLTSKSPGRSSSATPIEGQSVILLSQTPSGDIESVEAIEIPPSPEVKPSGNAPGLQIGPADHLAQEAVARGANDLVREKLARRGRSELRRKGFFSDTPDKGLFLIFAVLGFIGIFAAKQFSYSGLPVAFAAVGLLVLYAFVAARLDAFRSNPDRLGDNCYYMGFLFTLASLSAALIALQRDTASGRGDLLEALIGGFGIALFSTIGGITLRVFFMQMRREIEDLEEQLRTELQRSARLLTDQLANAVIDLENFRIRTNEVLNQHLDGAASGFSGIAEKLIEYVDTAGVAYNQASERLGANAERVAADIGRLVDRVERIDVPSDLLTRQVDDARGRIEALASALEAAVDAGGNRQSALEQSSHALDSLLLRLTDVARFAEIERSAERFGIAVEATTAKVSSVNDGLAAYASSIGGIAAQVERDGQTVARAREIIDQDLAQSTGALHKLQGTLADVADSLVARVTAPLPSLNGASRPGQA
jgi:hypothetical protein